MPTYQYRAQNMSGKIIEGVYDAADARAVAEMIRQKSFYILEINEVRESQDIGGFFARIGKRDIAILPAIFNNPESGGYFSTCSFHVKLPDRKQNIEKNPKGHQRRGAKGQQPFRGHGPAQATAGNPC